MESRVLIPRPPLFWAGVLVCSAGVGEHIVMFVDSASMDYRMAHMPVDASMWLAMVAIVAGLVMAAGGLVPRRLPVEQAPEVLEPDPGPVPEARRTLARRRLVAVLSFALVVDQMKPATLAFMLPGARAEYALTASEVAWLPMGGLTGTVIGSLLWGHLADRIGRRAAVLLAALLFVATTVCGAMPSFEASVFMCLLMGMSAGGMLPIVYALMSEVLPGRSGVMVLQAGLTTVGGYLAASGLAAVFEPIAGWRILWFVQLPLALALLALNRWIPESPAFLASRGRLAEARRMSRLFGLSTTPRAVEGPRQGPGALFGRGYLTQTLIICGYGLAWGLIYWGFLTFLPSLLSKVGVGVKPPQILFVSSLLSIPGTAVGAWLYSRWSSRKTMALYGATASVSLLALLLIPLHSAPAVIVVLMGLLTGTSGVVAVLGPYAAQTYPTAFRGMGSGLAAACGKSGGMFGPPLIAWMTSFMSLSRVAAVVAVPMALAATAVAARGKETAGRAVAAEGPDHDGERSAAPEGAATP
ncbi:MFS transporter [Streptomyces griseocarneus]|uniref:MFS transporter n=1 Tax=Streptomyces griseocarneus TaxID=51201 RepID=UPI0019C523B3|nr:MFS transporter [Streptomyces griseocarneus]MBZ6477634.1 MFS transporter [Streptomyces griseocarneus]GHG82204.1 MFS sugar transporter [Streptomyces griseocarneus]